MDTVKKVENYIEEKSLLQAGDSVVLGVSGGADSVALFRVLLSLREKYDLKLKVIHVEHGIRGEESYRDMRFVEKLCADYGVVCEVCHVDALAHSAESKLSVEEAARELRYRVFREKTQGKIAVAHNANDNAETILFQMVRGTGVKGLCGMSPMQDGIIRPLLCLERGEIEAYLTGLGQDYCEDSTNQDLAYDRNKIRHEILPLLQELNPKAIMHMNQSAEMLLSLWQTESQKVEGLLGEAAGKTKDPTRMLDVKSLLLIEDDFSRKTAIHTWLKIMTGHGKDISSVHVDDVEMLLRAETGTGVDLPYGKRVERSYDVLFFGEQNRDVDAEEVQFSQRIFPWDGSGEIPCDTYTKWLNYDKITGSLLMRTRSPGDYIVTCKDGGSKSIKDVFINEKIPREERERIPLLCMGNEVLWIVGYRISERFKIDKDTKQVIEIKVWRNTNG